MDNAVDTIFDADFVFEDELGMFYCVIVLRRLLDVS